MSKFVRRSIMGGVLIVFAVSCFILGSLKLGKVYVKYQNLKIANTVIQQNNDSLRTANGQLLRAWLNTISKGEKYDWVFFGNSITRNSDFRTFYRDKKILNYGLGGDDLMGMSRRTKLLGQITFDKLFVMSGINSVGKLPDDEFVIAYNALLDSILVYVEPDKIIVQSMLPISTTIEKDGFNNRRIESLNGKIREICNSRNIKFLDLYSLYALNGSLPVDWTMDSDGLHIIDSKYDKWAEAIKDVK